MDSPVLYPCWICSRSFKSRWSWERHFNTTRCGWKHTAPTLKLAVDLVEHLLLTPDLEAVGNVRLVILRQALRLLQLSSRELGEEPDLLGSWEAIREELGTDWISVARELADLTDRYVKDKMCKELLPDIWKRAVYLVRALNPEE